jgi:type II secretory pathway pseudopilin PulG
MRREEGFTIVEIVVAILILTVGLMAVAGTSALVTRMIARGQRSATAAIFAGQRLEQLRGTACAVRVAGSDTLYRAGAWAAINTWSFTDAGNSTWRIVLTSKHQAALGKTRLDTLVTEISCRV